MKTNKINYFLIIFLMLLVGCANQQNIPYNTPKNCYPDVAQEFLKWNKVNGKDSKGLTRRRQAEYNFFMKSCNHGSFNNNIKNNS